MTQGWASQPASIIIAALQLLGFITRVAIIGAHARITLGVAPRPPGLFVIHQPLEAVIGVAATLVLVGAAERTIGTLKTVIAYVVGCVIAGVAAVSIHLVVQAVFHTHLAEEFRVAFVPPYAPAVGTIMAASAFAGPLWRRRIRVGSVAAAAAFVLFEGNFSGLVTFVVALVGLGVGASLRRGRLVRRTRWVRSSHHEGRVLLSMVVAVTGGGLLASALGRTPVGPLGGLGTLFRDPFPHQPLSQACRVGGIGRGGDFILDPYGPCTEALARGGLHGPAAMALGIAPVTLLLITAYFLRRGLRAALVTATIISVLLSVGAFAQLWMLPNPPQDRAGAMQATRVLLTGTAAVIPLAITMLLIIKRRHAQVRSDRRVVMAAAASIIGLAIALVGLYTAAALTDESALQHPASAWSLAATGLLRLVPYGFSGITHLGAVPVSGVPRLFFENMGWVFWVIALIAVIAICRHRSTRTAFAQNPRLRELLHHGSNGPLAHMANWDGNQIWFHPDLPGAVAYRVVGDVAITVGEPVCEPQNIGTMTTGFALWCDDRGYAPVFYSVRSVLRPMFRSMGWYDLAVGEETIVRPRTFSLQGKKWQDIRSSINRAHKTGLRTEWTRYSDLPAVWARQIRDISEQWVAEKKLPEMGFTLGGVPELQDPEVRLMLAVNAEDRVDAITSWLPTYRDDSLVGWTLDFMRRRSDTMNGVMEYVIAATILQAQQDDLEFVSLSAAPLVSASDATSALDGIMDFLSRSLEPAYGFRSLFSFKKKFQPDYEELIMAYPDPLLLPRIGTALARAYLPDLAPRHVAHLIRRTP